MASISGAASVVGSNTYRLCQSIVNQDESVRFNVSPSENSLVRAFVQFQPLSLTSGGRTFDIVCSDSNSSVTARLNHSIVSSNMLVQLIDGASNVVFSSNVGSNRVVYNAYAPVVLRLKGSNVHIVYNNSNVLTYANSSLLPKNFTGGSVRFRGATGSLASQVSTITISNVDIRNQLTVAQDLDVRGTIQAAAIGVPAFTATSNTAYNTAASLVTVSNVAYTASSRLVTVSNVAYDTAADLVPVSNMVYSTSASLVSVSNVAYDTATAVL